MGKKNQKAQYAGDVSYWQVVKFNVKYRIPSIAVLIGGVISYGRWYAGEMLTFESIAYFISLLATGGMALYLYFVVLGVNARGKVTREKTIINRKYELVKYYEDEDGYEEDDPDLYSWEHYDNPDGSHQSHRNRMPRLTDDQYKVYYHHNPPASPEECDRLISEHNKLGNTKTTGKLLNLKRAIIRKQEKAQREKTRNDGGELNAPMDKSLSPTVNF